MFGDEIDQVRVMAIHVFALVCKLNNELVELKEEQLQIALIVLEDGNAQVRSAVHHLLSIVKVSNATCLHATIRALLANINKYNQDLPSVYKCLKHLALNQPELVELLVYDLLRMEKYMLLAEQKLDDEYCKWCSQLFCCCCLTPLDVAILVAIFNAASLNTSIISQLPFFTHQHYYYLHQKHPHLFPSLSLHSCTSQDKLAISYHVVKEAEQGESSASATPFNSNQVLEPFQSSYRHIYQLIKTGALTAASKALHSLQCELAHMAASLLPSKLNRNSLQAYHQVQFLNYYCTGIKHYVKALHYVTVARYDEKALEQVSALTSLLQRVEHLFSNLPSSILIEMKCLQLSAMMIHCIAKSSGSSSSSSSGSSSSSNSSEAGNHQDSVIQFGEIQLLRRQAEYITGDKSIDKDVTMVSALLQELQLLNSSSSTCKSQVILQLLKVCASSSRCNTNTRTDICSNSWNHAWTRCTRNKTPVM